MTPSPTRVAAVDLGAGSVRVCVSDLEARPPRYEVVHRVSHEPRRQPGDRLRWDWDRIREAVLDGLEQAAHAPLASIGVDAWGVDYGLLDAQGQLLAPPVCYRDDRTARYHELVDRIGERRMFAINGLQCMPINTIFQLAAEDRSLLDRARHVVTLPELVLSELTGTITAEISSAGTTGLVDQSTGSWSDELLDTVDVPANRFPEILAPGTRAGNWKGIPVHLVAGHDTASAVVGIGAAEVNPTFVSSGTWLLAGQELDAPVLTDDARRAGFTNEYGPESTTRFLKNVAGFWILEECRRSWGNPPVGELLADADDGVLAVPAGACFDATDQRFLAPRDMEAEVRAAAGLTREAPRPTVVAVIIASLARTAANVIAEATALSRTPVERVHLVGGGVRAAPFAAALREYVDAPLRVGNPESAALGNALVQGIALGCWENVAAARKELVA